ncbi:MAG: polysaccharide pyruvyl transferase CsaB [Candidatus Sericytochromatia bacterium]|nr:polysaccharide pyruvyl transferase CsaB [Candidatus Sericytochromatia bacterium]
MTQRILISGYYGYGNLGDEAILAATIAMFRAKAPDIQLTALSADPQATEAAHGIQALPRWGIAPLWRGLRQADLFLLGGGGLLQDVTSWKSPLYYAGQLVAARLAGTPSMLWAQGIGPLQGGAMRQAVGAALGGVRMATVRDAESVADLGRLGMSPGRILLTADPVLALRPNQPARADALLIAAGLEPRRPFLAIAIRPWKTWYERQLKSFTAVVSQMAMRWGLQILVIPFQYTVDRYLAEEAAYCLGCRPSGAAPRVGVLHSAVTAEDMMAVLGRAQFLIGMRLHSLIMGAAMGVPAVGIVYDPKVAAFSELAGYPTITHIGALSEGDTWARTLGLAWESQQEQRRYLSRQVPKLQAAAWQNVETALRLLGR